MNLVPIDICSILFQHIDLEHRTWLVDLKCVDCYPDMYRATFTSDSCPDIIYLSNAVSGSILVEEGKIPQRSNHYWIYPIVVKNRDIPPIHFELNSKLLELLNAHMEIE